MTYASLIIKQIYVVITTFNTTNQTTSNALDAITSSLVHGFFCGNITYEDDIDEIEGILRIRSSDNSSNMTFVLSQKEISFISS